MKTTLQYFISSRNKPRVYHLWEFTHVFSHQNILNVGCEIGQSNTRISRRLFFTLCLKWKCLGTVQYASYVYDNDNTIGRKDFGGKQQLAVYHNTFIYESFIDFNIAFKSNKIQKNWYNVRGIMMHVWVI